MKTRWNNFSNVYSKISGILKKVVELQKKEFEYPTFKIKVWKIVNKFVNFVDKKKKKVLRGGLAPENLLRTLHPF